MQFPGTRFDNRAFGDERKNRLHAKFCGFFDQPAKAITLGGRDGDTEGKRGDRGPGTGRICHGDWDLGRGELNKLQADMTFAQ